MRRAAEFARFLGLPPTRRANITDIIEAVCGVCTDTRTSVICVDEMPATCTSGPAG